MTFQDDKNHIPKSNQKPQKASHSRNGSMSNGKAALDELQRNASHKRDFYFGTMTELWLSELKLAKKRLQDIINAMGGQGEFMDVNLT